MESNKNIGALWQKEGERGTYFSGVLENEDGTKTKIVVFKNNYKDSENKPDYVILKAKEKQDNYKFNDDMNDDLPF